MSLHFCGVDPGKHGAIGVINATGTSVQVWDMPLDESKDIDLHGLRDLYRRIASLPSTTVGIEWPEAWPGAFNNVICDAELFGRQKGYLEAFAFLHNLEFQRISPVLWKGRLGLDGKQVHGSNERARSLYDLHYPEHQSLIRGLRGGLKDGRMDALLIAHFLRMRSADGMKGLVATHGKDSDVVFAQIMGGGRRKRKFGKRD